MAEQREVCAVVQLDFGRPGSLPLDACGHPPAADVTLGCEHEHIVTERHCADHAAKARDGHYACLRCWDAGCLCLMAVIRVEPGREECRVA